MSNQIRDFIITVLVVAFVFGFDDKQQVFQLGSWLANFLRVAVAVSIVVLVHYFGHKLAARHFGTDVVHKVWSIKRFGFATKAHFPIKFDFLRLTAIPMHSFPLGAVLAVIVTFVSNGKFFFTPVEAIDIDENPQRRAGRKFLKVSEKESARIAFAGPAASMVFAFLLQAFNSSGMFDKIILISCLYSLYHMIPISQLDGAKIFFGSPYVYVFGLVFLLLSFLLINVLSPGTAFFFAILGALAVLAVFFLRLHLPK